MLVNAKGKVEGRTGYSCQETVQDAIDTRSMTILEMYQSINISIDISRGSSLERQQVEEEAKKRGHTHEVV